jgi:ribonuclease HI
MGTPNVKIYTDGGCAPNPGPGGWGAILIAADGRRDPKELSGNDPDTTNNRMELVAAVQALRALRMPCVVEMYVDSQYVRQGITEWLPKWVANGWRTRSKQPVKNQDLWQALAVEVEQHQVTWHWVRGHNGDRYNERVDQLATEARLKLMNDKQTHNP